MKDKRHHYRRHAKRAHKKASLSTRRPYQNWRIDPALKDTFKRIGIPEAAPFRPDPFQLEALEKIQEHDVLVSAPTGAGKTWIASRAIEQYLRQGMKTWYASPLKALSNSIYQEFSGEFGPASCGILTGERKENPDAPVIVGTTEILRNQLYDAMHEGTNIDTDLVILDEAHYLSDPDRGVVWEEVLIYLPPRVRLLLLSATISNAEEVCAWLEKNRETRAYVVRSDERPVPLETLFLFPDGLIAPLAGRKGLTPRVKKFISSRMSHGKIRGGGKTMFGDIISCLREFDLLPAIFFLKSRMDCDKALELCRFPAGREEMRGRLKREVRGFLSEYPHLEGHRQMGPLLNSLVASHHAGQLPYWKLLIEKMMNKGLLEAIFSTSTVAAGVNFPARSVALVQSDRFNGHEFTDLTATDLHQMIGRAGRRGMDYIGFAVVIPGIHQDPMLINELMDSPPEPIISQIRINFSMTLNLLLSHSPKEMKTLLALSFAAFQQAGSDTSIQREWDILAISLQRILPNGNCDTSDPFEVLENIRKRSETRKGTETKAKGLACEGCEHFADCHTKKNRELHRILQGFKRLSKRMEGTSKGLWLSFKRHLRFLKETGFVDETDRLTADGIWASKLRLDQPLLIAEAIKRGGFSNISPEVMAGCIALFVWDRDQDVDLRPGDGGDLAIIEDAFNRVLESMEDVRKLKVARGFENPPILFWPAVALFLWAKGAQWERLLYRVPIGEGDIASMIVRSADHLRQVVNLKESHPELAIVAERAIELILREPVLIP
jgi:superfamily II RNA helicase